MKHNATKLAKRILDLAGILKEDNSSPLDLAIEKFGEPIKPNADWTDYHWFLKETKKGDLFLYKGDSETNWSIVLRQYSKHGYDVIIKYESENPKKVIEKAEQLL